MFSAIIGFVLHAIPFILGLISLTGFGLYGLTALGFGSGLIAWLIAKKVPWKLITIAAFALFVISCVIAGYMIFKDTQSKLVKASVELSHEKERTAVETKRADDYKTQHDDEVARIDQLEKDRSQIADQAATLQSQIDEMTLEQDLSHDSTKAVNNLNDRNSGLVRLLNRASQGRAASDQHAAPSGSGASSANPITFKR